LTRGGRARLTVAGQQEERRQYHQTESGSPAEGLLHEVCGAWFQATGFYLM
jgi:hypothetical protein